MKKAYRVSAVGGIALGLAAFIAVMGACGGDKPKVHSANDDMASLDAGTEPVWEGDTGAPSTAATAAADGPSGTEDGAKKLLGQFVDPKADHVALSKSLRPTAADYKALFDDTTAPKMEAAYAKDWDSGSMVIKPKNDKQSEIKLWSATGADLAAGTGNAKEFPGGYKKIGKHLAPTVTFYAFKFVEPKKDAGMAYDGLAYVNAHWVIVPKPFHHQDAAGDDHGDKHEKHEKRAGKPHGKKK